MLVGEFEISSDDKSRISLPIKFKEELFGKDLVATKGIGANFISIYYKEDFEKVKTKLFEGKNSSLSRSVSLLQRVFIASSYDFVLEKKTDRILFPMSLRQYAKIEERANLIVLGLQDRLEIWRSDIYAKYLDDNLDLASEKAEEVFESLLREEKES